MLTISKPLSSGQAQAYHRLEFTADSQNYYKQDGAVEGEWQGELAKVFELAGAPVDERHFALLTEGKHPQTEEQIVGRRPGKEQAKPEEAAAQGEAATPQDDKQKTEQAEVKEATSPALATVQSEAKSLDIGAQATRREALPTTAMPLDNKQNAEQTDVEKSTSPALATAQPKAKTPETEEKDAKREAVTTTAPVEHRAGWDATFSAPKSVSLTALVGGDERVREAHREAVTAALAELERYTQGRIGGNHPGETTGRLIAAKFEHDTARPVDGYAAPQLHTHAVIFNMTQLDDGRMRALQPKSLFDSQSYVTAVYQSELTFRLRELGYELTVGRSGAPEIEGYTQEYLDASSLRSQQIREQLAQSGFQGPAAAQIAAHATRDSKQLLSPEEVLAAHRQLAAEFGNQATTVVTEARERAQTQAQTQTGTAERKAEQPESNNRAQAAVSYAKEHIFEREAVADRRGILRDALRHGMGEVRPGEIYAEFERRQAQGEFRRTGSRAYDTDLRFTTPATIAAERANVAHMRAGQGAMEPMMPAKMAKEHAAMRTFLNSAQRTVIEEVLTSRDRIHGLQGLAGTGKTTTLESIRQGAELGGYAVEGFAPTSRAAAQLREAGISAGTLQGFLARGNQGQDDPASRHLYMLDESSFASTRQMRAFLEKLGPNDRVLAIGDIGQHQGVDAGRPFEQMQQAGMRTSQLDQIMRQRDPELRKAVEHLAKGETSKGVAVLGEQGRVTEVADQKERIAAIVKDYAANPKNTIIVSPDNASRREINQSVRAELQATGAVKGDGKEFPTLIPRSDMTGADRAWAARYAENDVLLYAKGSKALGIERGSYATVTATHPARNEITVRRDDGQSVTYDPARLRGVTAYRELPRELATGDRIQFTAGNEKLGVANRDLATISAIEPGKMTVRMDGGLNDKEKRSVSFDPDKMRHIDHGYAVTSHSSQGTTASRVLVNIDTEALGSLINTRLAYVSISRAANDARIYTNKADTLHEKLAAESTKTVAVEYSAKAREQAHAGYRGPKRSSDGSEPMPVSRTAELRHAVAMLGTEEARIGVNLLERQGRITVEPDRDRRLAAMVRDYAAEPKNAVAVVPSAGERRQLNEAIRGELRRTGALGSDDRTVPVLVERQINRRDAGAYEVGDRIEFRAGSPERGIEPNSGAKVLAVNSERNQLTIQRQDGELTTYNPSRLKATRQSKVYREESRELEIGDRIRVTADHKPSGIRAGDLATVEAIRGIGALQVRLDSGKLAELEPAQARHIEYGYAVEGAQRVKADRLLASVESPAQLAPESLLYKAVQQSKDAAFYTPERSALYEARTPEEIERFLARTAETRQALAPDPLRAPLDRVLDQAEARQFEWVARTGTIQTYQHQETGRNLHIDGVTGQFYDQARNPIGKDAALAHAQSDSPIHAKQESAENIISPVISQNQPSQGHRLRM